MMLRLLFLVPLTLLAGCGTNQQSITNSAGTQAALVERLWWTMLIVLTVIFVLVVAAIGRSVQRSRGGTPAIPEREVISPEQDRRMSRIIAVLVVMVAVLELSFLVMSAYSINVHRSPESKNAIEIQVVGHRWWWEFRYSSPVPSETVVTANELHIPAGVPVLIKTSSADVIHSFWFPNIAGKRDLIPGYMTSFWVQAEKEGVYRGQCAEYCGHQHAHMGMYVVVESLQEFQDWLNAQKKPAPDPPTDEARRGQQLFLSSPCVTCHTVRGTDAGSRVGPDLTHVATRSFIAAGTLPNTRDNLARWVRDSQSVKPGNTMPTMSLTPEDVQAIVTYLQSLK